MVLPPDSDEQSIALKEIPSLTVASVESTGSFEQITRVFMDLFRWVLVKGGRVNAYPVVLFPASLDKVPAEGVRFEACIPLDPSSELTPEEDVSVRELPACTVAFSRT